MPSPELNRVPNGTPVVPGRARPRTVCPGEVLERPYTAGGGGALTRFLLCRRVLAICDQYTTRLRTGGTHPLDPPPPHTPKGPSREKAKFTIGKIWSGHFWDTNFFGSQIRTPPPPRPDWLTVSLSSRCTAESNRISAPPPVGVGRVLGPWVFHKSEVGGQRFAEELASPGGRGRGGGGPTPPPNIPRCAGFSA